MDILIPDSWLRDFLTTAAPPKMIAKYLSLCGPSVNKIEKQEDDHIYHIEVTTNRVDSVSIVGIAREAVAILPRFGIKAKYHPPTPKANLEFSRQVNYLTVESDKKLCLRFSALLIKNVHIKPSPQIIKDRLIKVGVRPINNVIDISNYIMHELGQPVHTFDYDKIAGAKMILRPSKKGERITTLDGKTHTLLGSDIVIEDGKGRLIDLAGIMGGENSQVDSNTKNVLLFVQTYNPLNIRRSSMNLAQRTEAAVLFEKGLDTQLVTLGIKRGIDLFVQLTEGNPENKILDIYPNLYKTKRLSTDLEFIRKKLGVEIERTEVGEILNSLGFEISWSGQKLSIGIPSFRSNDINIAEDIVEEVARLYGYHNLPSLLMEGSLPEPSYNTPFEFEKNIKHILKATGATEVYSYSMVAKEFIKNPALKLINPLGSDSEFMRTTLIPSLLASARQNSGIKDPFHLFEMANVYLPRRSTAKTGLPQLPEEKMNLAGVFANYTYRNAKGIIENLLNQLRINYAVKVEDAEDFLPNHRLIITSTDHQIGQFGILDSGLIYYDFDIDTLSKIRPRVSQYKPIPKYPAQIEDITLVLPSRTKVGDLIASIKLGSKLVKNVDLTDIYNNSYTFRLWYQHPKKTLTDDEVEKIRNKILEVVKKKYGVTVKD